MKFKSAASMFMFKFFAFLSGSSFLILMCVSDVPVGEGWKVAVTILFTVFTALIAVLIYDYTIVSRHIFAIDSVFSLVTGVILKKRSKKHIYLYKTYMECDSISEFYSHMIHKYDIWKINR